MGALSAGRELGGLGDEDGARGFVCNVLCNTAEDATDALNVAIADEDQICIDSTRLVQEHLSRCSRDSCEADLEVVHLGCEVDELLASKLRVGEEHLVGRLAELVDLVLRIGGGHEVER